MAAIFDLSQFYSISFKSYIQKGFTLPASDSFELVIMKNFTNNSLYIQFINMMDHFSNLGIWINKMAAKDLFFMFSCLEGHWIIEKGLNKHF